MLVLSRKLQESIVMPELGITIRVIGVSGGRVRLGVEAPRDIAIARGEILEEMPDVHMSRRGDDRSLSRSGEHAAVGL